jgi:hypothetical protein
MSGLGNMTKEKQRNRSKRSSATEARFFWQIARGAAEFLQEMANLREDGVRRFEQKYAPSFDRYDTPKLLELRDELRALWTNGKQMPPSLNAVWDNEKAAATGILLNEFICNRWLRASGGGLVVLMGEIQPDINSPLALLAYCAHLRSDKMKVCANEDCPSPYFIGRRGQRYCSSKCAGPAKRAAKLRSWHEHKNKWPSQRRKRRKGLRSAKRRKRR